MLGWERCILLTVRSEIRTIADVPTRYNSFTVTMAVTVARPRVLVVALPYVYATAIAARLRHEQAYDVFAPNIGAGETAPPLAYDAVLTTGAITDVASEVVITLPVISFDDPVIVTVGGVT